LIPTRQGWYQAYSNAEVGQVFAGIKFVSFLTADMESKNDPRHDIEYINARIFRCHVWHRFLTPCLTSKTLWTSYLQSLAKLRHLTLHMLGLLGINKLRSFSYSASTTLMVLVNPAPCFQPVTTTTGCPALMKPRSFPTEMAASTRASTSAIHSAGFSAPV